MTKTNNSEDDLNTSIRSKKWTVLGWMSAALFIIIYGIELMPHQGPPVTIRWIREVFGQAGLIVLNIVIVLAFLTLLPYRRSTKNLWKSQGAFIAFVIALMTEMFGWPLLIFLVSPLISIPVIAPAFLQSVGYWAVPVGTAISFFGLILVALGWFQIHRSENIVTTGIYKYIRHPQYTGIFLFTFGWIVHWLSLITLILWLPLIGAYFWLAKREERQAIEEFGTVYLEYAKRTRRFIPFIV